MALNVKAAMLICMGFIGAASWVLQQSGPRRYWVAAPPAVREVPAELGRARSGDEFALPGKVGRRADWARKFVHPNALDRQLEEADSESEPLALLPPREPVTFETARTLVPPLVSVPEVAALDEPGPGEPVSGNGQVALVEDLGIELPSAAVRMKCYRVVKSDSLTKIARREWKSSDQRLIGLLREVNPKLRDRKNSVIFVGEELLVPDEVTARRVLAGEPLPGPRNEPDVEVASAGPPATDEDHWYTVRRDDTLMSIARRLLDDGKRWREIVELNGRLDPERILPGTRLRIPAIRMATR